MGVIAEEVVRIKADTGTFKQDVDQASGGVSKLGMVAGAAALGGVALLGKGLLDGVKAAIAHESALAQTEAVIKSTAGSAGVTAKGVTGLADSIEKMSGIDDLNVQAGENMLLTFTNIKNGVGAGNQVFDDATKTLADMSVALGTDMKTSAIQLGKALNDPIKGVGALSRVGVTFTAGQKASIAAMVEHGNTAGAQKIILAELSKEFGGSAKAAGGTFAGQVNILKAHLEDLEQEIGAKVLPILTRFVAWIIANWPKFASVARAAIASLVDAWSDLQPAIQKVISVVSGAISVISDIVKWLNQNRDVAAALGVAIGIMAAGFVIWTTAVKVAAIATKAYAAVQAILNVTMMGFPVILIIAAIALVVAGLILLYQRSETARAIMDAVFDAMKTAVSTAVAIIVPLVEKIADIVSTVVSTVDGLIHSDWQAVWDVFSTIVSVPIGIVTGYIEGVVNVISGVFALVDALIHGEWSAAWDALVQIVTGYLQLLNAMMMGIPGMILGVIIDAAAAALQVGQAILNGIVGTLTGLATSVLGFITDAVGAVTGAVQGAIDAAAAFGGGIITGVTNAAGTLATVVGGFLSGAATAITSAVAGVIQVAATFGAGIITGVTNAAGALATTVGGFLSAAATAITNAVAGVINVAKTFGAGILSGVVEGATGIAGKVGGLIAEIPPKIREFVDNVGSAALAIGNKIVSSVVEGLGDLLSGIGNVLRGIPQRIRDVASDIGTLIATAAGALGGRIVDAIISGVGGLAGRLAGWISDLIADALSKVNPFGGGSGEPFQGSPTGPPFRAAGGWTTGPELAWIGEAGPEVVIPTSGKYRSRALSLLGQAASALNASPLTGSPLGRGGGSASVTIGLNDTALASAVYALVDELRASRSGGAPVTVVATGGASAAVYSARR